MPQYRDLHQSGSSKKLPLSDRMKKLIQKEKDSYKNPICEFCETPYNESKTEDCFQCKCMREGRRLPHTDTYRELIKASDEHWNEKTDLRTVGLTERD